MRAGVRSRASVMVTSQESPERVQTVMVELTNQAKDFIGRLKLRCRHSLPIRPNLETYYRRLEVLEVLREQYSG